jgi:hypothetical protein
MSNIKDYLRSHKIKIYQQRKKRKFWAESDKLCL